MKKTILINVTSSMPEQDPRWGGYLTGIGHATKALVDALYRIKNNPYNIELYASGMRSLRFDFHGWNYKHHIIPVPHSLRINDRHLDSYVRPLLYKYSLFHLPEHIFDVSPNENFIVTIHDCTDMDVNLSADMSAKEREFSLKKYKVMTNDSKLIITDSIASKSDIIKYFNVNPDKVVVNYLGVDKKRFRKLCKTEIDVVLQKYNINSPYFFACSCNRPRKNLITALRAFKKFLTYSPQHIFVVAWSNPFPEIKEEFGKEIKEKKILFLPFLSESEIVALYNGASMSVYVSRKEGFGMPILESFACGTPVMTCNNSSLPEVGQDAAIYVGEDNIDEMVDVMRIFESTSYNQNLFMIKSKVVLEKFSWDETAKRCLKIYDMCI